MQETATAELSHEHRQEVLYICRPAYIQSAPEDQKGHHKERRQITGSVCCPRRWIRVDHPSPCGSKEVRPEKQAGRIDPTQDRQELQVPHEAAVSFTIAPIAEPKKKFKIQSAFTSKELGLAEHTHPIGTLQQMYRHLARLPLQSLNRVHPVLLISDCTHLITPIEPVRLGPPGGPVAVRTRLGWTKPSSSCAASIHHSASSRPHRLRLTCSHMWRNCGR